MPTTSVKLAARIARHLELDSDGKTRLHRVFRNLVTRSIVPGTVDPDDARGTIAIDHNAAAVAVLLLPLADLTIDARGLREVASFLLKPDFLIGETEVPIERAVAAVQAGKDVRLVTELFWLTSSATTARQTRLLIEGDSKNAAVGGIVKAWRDAFTVELARVEVPASIWLRMFLAND